MTTYNCADASKTKSYGADLEVWQTNIDFSMDSLDAGLGDVAQVLRVPASAWVLMAFLKVIKKCPANSTVNFGYGGDADYFGHSLPISTVGSVPLKTVLANAGLTTIFKDYAPMMGSPLYFSAVDTLDLTATTEGADVNISSGIVEVNALIWRV